jgi:hypothetical protein
VPCASKKTKHTKLLLDDLEDLLLVELLGETLDSCQSLTTIALYCKPLVSIAYLQHGVRRGAAVCYMR